MRITHRDEEVIRFINEFGFCDIPRLKQRFAIQKTQMYDTMQRLVIVGLVHYQAILHQRHGVYFVSRKGAKLTDLPPQYKISLGQYEHQLAIIDVHLKLKQKYPDASWISERRLKQEKFSTGLGKRGHTSDGILVFPDDKQIAIEVEMSVKSKSRLEKILREYVKQRLIKEVWYYCLPEVMPAIKTSATRMPFVKIYNLVEFLT